MQKEGAEFELYCYEDVLDFEREISLLDPAKHPEGTVMISEDGKTFAPFKMFDADGDGVRETPLKKGTLLGTYMTGADGVIRVDGLSLDAESGTAKYAFVEKTAPDGYISSDEPVVFEVKDTRTDLTEKTPVDTVAADAFDANANSQVVDTMAIPDGWMGLDIGPKTIELFSAEIKAAKTVIWNGPAGVFEFEKFAVGTKALAQAIAESSAISIIGGGGTSSGPEGERRSSNGDHPSPEGRSGGSDHGGKTACGRPLRSRVRIPSPYGQKSLYRISGARCRSR